jgi:hypothetical protein
MPDRSLKSEKEAIAQFKLKIKNAPSPTSAPLQAGNGLWYSALTDRVLTGDDIAKFANGAQVIYSLDYISWKDPTGFHYFQSCRVTQPPAFSPDIWNMCSDYSAHK